MIELLAVIVILAIIALIATPMVLNIIKDSKSSSIDKSYRTNGLKYVIDYSEYNARLIIASEVAKITNNIQFNEVTASSHDDIFYFDSNTSNQSDDCMYGNTIGCKYGWLYDRTGIDCTKNGCLNNSDVYTIGYWTASPMYKYAAWYVSSGSIGEWGNFVENNFGVRPVIEVLRSKLN